MAGVRGVVTYAVTDVVMDVVMDEHRAEGTTLIPDETIRIFWVWVGGNLGVMKM